MHALSLQEEGRQGSRARDGLLDNEKGGDEVDLAPDPAEAEWRQQSSPQRQSSVILNVGATDTQVRLNLANVSYTVPVGPKKCCAGQADRRKILHDISAAFHPGQLTALMGPSGAGKTTVMNVLTDNVKHELTGDVLTNGKPVDRRFKSYFNLVPQEDVLLPALTPRETMRYAADLRLGEHLSPEDKEARIMKILQVLGLDDGQGNGCADTIVGDVEKRGISGGQRKRLSIGLELLTNPSVLFLDEPTSGLDSKAAEDVIRVLRALAKSGKTIICTIHQPSWQIFERFDRLLLLCRGRVVYDGPTRLMPGYVKQLSVEHRNPSWACPALENPVDHTMRIIQESTDAATFADEWSRFPPRDMGGMPGADLYRDAWRKDLCQGKNRILSLDAQAGRAEVVPVGRAQYDPEEQGPELEPLTASMRYENSACKQFRVLIHRYVYESVKDQKKFVAQCMLKFTVSLMVGLCWFNTARPPKYGDAGQSAFTATGALFICINNCLMDNIFACVIQFPVQRSLLLREYKNGSYGLLPWFFALYLGSMLFQMLYCLVLSVPVYLLVGFRLDEVQHPFIFIATLFICSSIGVAIGLMVGATSNGVQEAQQKVMPTIVPMLLFSGWVIPYHDIPIFLKWVYWISVFQYSFSILKVNQFDGLKFDDQHEGGSTVEQQVPCADVHIDFGPGMPTIQDYCKTNNKTELGFDITLPEVDGAGYLKQQNLGPSNFSHPMWHNFLLLGAVWLVCLFMAYRIIRKKAGQKTG